MLWREQVMRREMRQTIIKQNWKGDASIFFRPNDNTHFSYTYRAAHLNNIYQRSNRFRLENYVLQQHILQYKSKIVAAEGICYIREHRGFLQPAFHGREH